MHPPPYSAIDLFSMVGKPLITSFVSWQRSGVSVDCHLATLSGYLGHVAPSDTYWYLSAVPELMELAASRLEVRFGSPR